MCKKIIVKRIITMLTVLAMVVASGTTAFAAEANTSAKESVASVQGDTLPSKLSIASAPFANISGETTLSINIPAGKTARSIYVLGNKEGGGANTTMTFIGTGISAFGKTVNLNGQYYKISAAGWSQTGGTLTLNVTINSSGVYNLVFFVYD